MSIELKIHRGTGRQTGDSLCQSCQHGLLFTDARGEQTQCSVAHEDNQPRGKVTDCSDYYNKGLPSIRDFREIAWELKTDKGGRAVGFTPPTKKKQGWEED